MRSVSRNSAGPLLFEMRRGREYGLLAWGSGSGCYADKVNLAPSTTAIRIAWRIMGPARCPFATAGLNPCDKGKD